MKVVSCKIRPLCPRKKEPPLSTKEARRAPQPVRTFSKGENISTCRESNQGSYVTQRVAYATNTDGKRLLLSENIGWYRWLDGFVFPVIQHSTKRLQNT
jgi:hypothetical protein